MKEPDQDQEKAEENWNVL